MMNRDNFSYFSMKPYLVIPHRDGSDEGSQHMFLLTKIIPSYHQLLPLTYSSGSKTSLLKCTDKL